MNGKPGKFEAVRETKAANAALGDSYIEQLCRVRSILYSLGRVLNVVIVDVIYECHESTNSFQILVAVS